MSGIYDEYRIALLDSSFFVSRFSEEVKRGLSNIKVYVSDAFNSEIEQYRLILSPEKQRVFDSNVRFINENMRLNTLNLDSFGERSKHLHNDIWGLITLLIELNAKFVIVTANKILIQRIVLNELKVDIYNLNSNGFIRYSVFPSLKSKYNITEATWINSPVDIKVAEGSYLFCEDHSVVILDKEIKTGLEASLYIVRGKSNSIAKIFKRDKLSASKFKNIQLLSRTNRKPEVNWAIFPKEVLYYDVNCTNPAGFIEDYVLAENNLDDNPLFLGDPSNITEECLLKRQSYAIDLCLKIVRQVCYLNIYGFYISDYNMGNFATIKNDEKNIQMWDTDSFGYESFFGKVFSPDYVESINHSKYNISTKEGAIEMSNDALYQFVFLMLSLGDSPISERTRKFKYDNPNYFALSRKKFFPMNIWKHFEDVFRGEKVPSAEALMRQLVITSYQLRQNSASNKTFKQLFIEVIPGYEEVLKKLEFERKLESEGQTEKFGDMNDKTQMNNTNARKSGNSNRSRSSNKTNSAKRTRSAASYRKRKASKKKSKHKIGVIMLMILIIFGGTGYYVLTTQNSAIESSDKSYFDNAEYVGWNESDAISDIEAIGWTADCEDAYSWTYKKGVVVSYFYSESTKTVTLKVSQGPEEPEDVENIGANISVSETDVVMNKGESVKLIVAGEGNCPDSYYFGCEYLSSIQAEWGDWIGNRSTVITFTGNSSSDTGYIRFKIVDGDTEKTVGYTDIFITVQ